MAILTIYQLINQSMPWRRNLLVLSKLSYTNLIPQIQINTTGFSKNPHHKVLLGFSSIVLASNMLEGWYIFHSKGGIHSCVWSTKPFLYDIKEPRYKQIKMRRQIKINSIGQTSVLKSDVPYCFACISAPLCFTEIG